METRYSLSAHYIKHSLNLAKVEQKNTDLVLWRKERNLLVYKHSETQYICVYSFGVVTIFGIEDKKEKDKLLRRFAKGGEEEPGVALAGLPTEDYPVIVDHEAPEAVEFNVVRLKHLSVDKLLLVFHVIAQSVAIDFLENQVEETLQRFEKIHMNLAKKGLLIATSREVMKTIGFSGNIVNFIVGQLSLLDKPDIAWEDRDAESLFINLRKMFELEDRFSTIRFKLTFIQDSSELVLDSLNHRRSELLELTVILLIVFEIVMAFVRR
ncbi:MAG: hypothetical protein RL272_334 [Candidatus Parcubacteria bacterium]|jgi:uncharacterized Rmd1/YagE family protein